MSVRLSADGCVYVDSLPEPTLTLILDILTEGIEELIGPMKALVLPFGDFLAAAEQAGVGIDYTFMH